MRLKQPVYPTNRLKHSFVQPAVEVLNEISKGK